MRRTEHEAGRFTLVYLAAPGDEDAQIELTIFLATQDLSGDYRRFNNGGQLIEVREDSIGVVPLALSRPRLRPRARQ